MARAQATGHSSWRSVRALAARLGRCLRRPSAWCKAGRGEMGAISVRQFHLPCPQPQMAPLRIPCEFHRLLVSDERLVRQRMGVAAGGAHGAQTGRQTDRCHKPTLLWDPSFLPGLLPMMGSQSMNQSRAQKQRTNAGQQAGGSPRKGRGRGSERTHGSLGVSRPARPRVCSPNLVGAATACPAKTLGWV